jgi:ribose transport system permease protein
LTPSVRMDVSFDVAWTAVSQRPAVNRAMPALVSLVILLAIAGALIPSFLLPDRLLLLGQQVAPLALVAIGQTLVVLMGGIDLSVGSILTLSLVLGAGLIARQ